MKISDVYAREIIDSRGKPALEATVVLENGSKASAATPTLPTHQRDNDEKRYNGYGLLQAVSHVETLLKPAILGMNVSIQQEVDEKMLSIDTSPEKTIIGKNALISVSKAVAKAGAITKQKELFAHLREILQKNPQQIRMPVPSFTMIDGGKNANFTLEMQEFIIIPASFKPFRESIMLGTTFHAALRELLVKENLIPLVGEKGGFGPVLATNEDALQLLKEVTESLNIRLGYDLYLGIDVSAQSVYKDKRYKIKDAAISMNSIEFATFLEQASKKYHILYLEDAMAFDDTEGWQALYKMLNLRSVIAGDYLTATDPIKLQHAVTNEMMNAIVIKPDQIGTVSEALAVSEMARAAGIKLVVSDSTGETTDTFLADFAIAIDADYIRFGAPVRGERVAKYNRLLEIDLLRQLKKE